MKLEAGFIHALSKEGNEENYKAFDMARSEMIKSFHTRFYPEPPFSFPLQKWQELVAGSLQSFLAVGPISFDLEKHKVSDPNLRKFFANLSSENFAGKNFIFYFDPASRVHENNFKDFVFSQNCMITLPYREILVVLQIMQFEELGQEILRLSQEKFLVPTP